MIRVGLTQRVAAFADRDERRDELDQRWATLLGDLDLMAIPIPNCARDPIEYARDLGVAMLVLTGGNDLATLPNAAQTAPERDATEGVLLDHAAEHRIPVLAVCRGMQLLVTRSGGTVERGVGHAGTVHAIARTDAGQALRTGPVWSYHDWVVPAGGVPDDYVVLATAPDGTIESIRHRTLPWVGIMWHPERDVRDADDVSMIRALVRAAS